MVNIKKELLEIPQALQQMWEEGCPLYDTLIRRVNWGIRPVFMIGNGTSYPAALSGAWTFEALLGLPVVVRRAAVFNAYSSRTPAVRSLVIMLSGSGEDEETVQAATKARNRGTILWAITANSASRLAGLADGVVNCYIGESPESGARSVFCQHAVFLFLALAAARVLKAPSAQFKTHEEELGKLAKHVDWVLNQISNAAGTLAKELSSLPTLCVVGAGAFHAVALQAASRLGQLAGVRASGLELTHFQETLQQPTPPGSGILYLSSSRCGLKGRVHQSARESRQKGDQKIFAITDSNDRQLSERADLAVLLPALTEAGGALLALVFLELVTYYAAKASGDNSALRRKAGTS